MSKLRDNAQSIKRASGGKLCAVVKANAYGHGAEEITHALADIADMFAVALIEEGTAIRASACGKDILVFTPPMDEEQAYHMAANNFLVTLPDLHTARLFAAVCARYHLVGRVHLKVNTGMNRYGMNASMLGKVCTFLRGNPHIQVEGIYSHLYACNREIAYGQRSLFFAVLAVAKRYFPSIIAHMGATYGVCLGKDFTFDMVRVGLGLYGYAPAPCPIFLQPVMQVYAKSVGSRKYSFGGVGYGNTTTEKGSTVALLRVGYADGFLRTQYNGMENALQNINNLCMDVCLRRGKKARGQLVPLLVNAEKIAEQTGTISYEVLCAATRRAQFIYEE